MPGTLEILADFDNIQDPQYKRDPLLLLLRTLKLVEPNVSENINRIRLKYYGGWYEGSSLTRLAQQLIVHIGMPASHVAVFKNVRTIATIELAHGIEAYPNACFPNTVRHRTKVMDINCKSSSEIGCTEPSCPMDIIQNFVRNSHCPSLGCSTTARDVLKKREQKLVDTCLAVDIVTLGFNKSTDIVVISSDDDFWPALLAALKHGTKVHRIRTQQPSSFEQTYNAVSSNAVINYDL